MRHSIFTWATTGALSALGLVTALVGCRAPVGPEERLALGLIEPSLHGDVAPLALPPAARAGEPVSITVTTFGSSSCTRADGAEVRVSGLVADVTAYDWVPADPQTPCTRDLATFPRKVGLRFATPGEAVVRLHGRGYSVRVEGSLVETTITLEGRLRVEP